MNHIKKDALQILRKCTGIADADFRPGQWEAIDGIVNRREKRVVIEKTGWGKSYVYFVATKLLRSAGAGPTIIISPLLALMRNQLDAANRVGLNSVTINSTNRRDWPELTAKILGNEADLVLISPERLANEGFVEEVLLPITQRLGLFVVDEAHCISDWGHDFRPDYRRLVSILKLMPVNVPVLGTTATANDRVIADIQSQLGDFVIQRGPLMRDSISLQTITMPDQQSRLAWLAQHVPDLPGTGIVYVLTKKDADRVAKWLNQNGITAQAYYSGVKHPDYETSDEYRMVLEEKLLQNQIKALVATTALGMGYDKPDIGFVIHYQCPGSVIAYYQQVGRAGRALDKSYGILMTGQEDADIQEFFRKSAFPGEEKVRNILKVLGEHDGIRLSALEREINMPQGKLKAALKYLSVESPSPVLKEKQYYYRTPVFWQMDTQKIKRLTNQRVIEWQEIQGYMNQTGCLMKFLADSLDDHTAGDCGKCMNCRNDRIISEDVDYGLTVSATRFIKQSEMELNLMVQTAPDAFPVYGFKGNLPTELRAETGRVLSRWNDPGWGKLVADGKHRNHFSHELVEAIWEMITQRWKPDPFPEWIACVTSLNHTELVPDFARRLSAHSGLPFRSVIHKVKTNDPQKLQLNRFHRCNNLDGVFRIEGPLSSTPVFLLDDIVDSRWTLTVVSALLRQNGSGPVYPLALATSESGG